MTTDVLTARGIRPGVPLAAEWQLALPLLLVFVSIFLAALVLLACISAAVDNDLTSFGPDQYIRFASDPFHWRIALNTVLLGLKTVAFTTVMAYPLALLYLEIGPRARRLLVFAILLPLLTGTVVRTFAWVVILGSEGLVNTTIAALGLNPVRLLHTEFGLVLSLSQIELPIMLLPLLSVMHRIDRNLIDASMSLGAGYWRTLRRVILPLSVPGLHRRRDPGVREFRDLVFLADHHRRGAARLSDQADLRAGDDRVQLAVRGGDRDGADGVGALGHRAAHMARTQGAERLWMTHAGPPRASMRSATSWWCAASRRSASWCCSGRS